MWVLPKEADSGDGMEGMLQMDQDNELVEEDVIKDIIAAKCGKVATTAAESPVIISLFSKGSACS